MIILLYFAFVIGIGFYLKKFMGTPEELFRGTYVGFNPTDFPWDIHPDGNRFLMIKTTAATVGQQAKINIVLNWFEELKQRVPVE